MDRKTSTILTVWHALLKESLPDNTQVLTIKFHIKQLTFNG